MEKCIIYGTGGHALTVEELAKKQGYDVVAFFDDHIRTEQLYRERIVVKYDRGFNSQQPVVIAIGNNELRKRVATVVTHAYCTLKDSSVIFSSDAHVGEGTVLMPGVIVQAGPRIGQHVIINVGAAIDHQAVIGDFVHIGAKCYIGGAAVIGEGANIGAGTVIMRNVVVEPWAQISPQSLII